MILGSSRGWCAEMTFPKTEGGKFCTKSTGDELASEVAAISYGTSTFSRSVVCKDSFKDEGQLLSSLLVNRRL